MYNNENGKENNCFYNSFTDFEDKENDFNRIDEHSFLLIKEPQDDIYFLDIIKNIEHQIEYEQNSNNPNKINKDKIGEETISKNEEKEKNKKFDQINIKILDLNESTKKSTNKIINKSISNKIEKENKSKKYSILNNTIKKVKNILIKIALNYINRQIKKIYGGKIGKGIFIKQLLNIASKEKEKSDTKSHKEFLYKTFKDVFDTNLQSKYNIIHIDFNKKLISELLNEKDEEKKKLFKDLFEMTFLEFIQNLSDPDEELKECYENILKEKTKNDENKLNVIKDFINNYEVILNERKERKRKKN